MLLFALHFFERVGYGALIRGWALIRINTVCVIYALCTQFFDSSPLKLSPVPHYFAAINIIKCKVSCVK